MDLTLPPPPPDRDPSEIGKSFLPITPGKCHCAVEKFDAYGSPSTGSHQVYFKILASHETEDIGRSQMVFFDSGPPTNKPESTFWSEKLFKFLMACGVVSPDEIRESQKEGVAISADPSKSVGCQLLVEFERSKDAKYINIAGRGFAMWAVTDPIAEKFPTDKKALANAKLFKEQMQAYSTEDMDTQANDLF